MFLIAEAITRKEQRLLRFWLPPAKAFALLYLHDLAANASPNRLQKHGVESVLSVFLLPSKSFDFCRQ